MFRLVIWPSMMLLGWTETTLWALKYDSMISVIIFKIGKLCVFYLSFFQIEGAGRDFTIVIKLIEKFKSLYGFGGRCLKIRDVYRDFAPYFKVHSLVSFHPKSMVKWPTSTWSCMWWFSVCPLIKIWNSPQFPAEFRNGQHEIITTTTFIYTQKNKR